MKFGKYIDEQARPDWRDKYLDYGQLKQFIKEAVAQLESGSDETAFSPRTTSLSVAKNHNESPEASFFTKLETEVHFASASAQRPAASRMLHIGSLPAGQKDIRFHRETRQAAQGPD